MRAGIICWCSLLSCCCALIIPLHSTSPPRTTEGGANTVVDDAGFSALAAVAIASGDVLDLSTVDPVFLREPFKHTGTRPLRVCGGTICGDGHSIFQVGGSSSAVLELIDVHLDHRASPARGEKRSLGAAVFARGKGRVVLRGGSVRSEAGFGLWLAQRSAADVARCALHACGRSTIVAFERARLRVADSTLIDAAPHAICARGRARVIVRRCRLERAAVRAVYCYHSCELDIADSVVAGTVGAGAAAVQIEALRPGDGGRLVLTSTVFSDNTGGDLSVAGDVEKNLTDCDVVERVPELFGPFSSRDRDWDANWTPPELRQERR